MNPRLIPGTLLCFLILMSSCSTSRLLKDHHSDLEHIAYGDLEPREKFDAFGDVMADVLQDAFMLKGPKQTFRFLYKFSRQNEHELMHITNDLEEYMAHMKVGQKVAFAGHAMSQPYAKQLMHLIPEIKSRMDEGGYKLGPLDRAIGLFVLKRAIKQKKK